MGKTFKDQRKWERKQRDKEEKMKVVPKKKQKFHEEILPDDDMDAYEYLDYEYEDDDR